MIVSVCDIPGVFVRQIVTVMILAEIRDIEGSVGSSLGGRYSHFIWYNCGRQERNAAKWRMQSWKERLQSAQSVLRNE